MPRGFTGTSLQRVSLTWWGAGAFTGKLRGRSKGRVNAWLEGLSDIFGLLREFKHLWLHHKAISYRKNGLHKERSLVLELKLHCEAISQTILHKGRNVGYQAVRNGHGCLGPGEPLADFISTSSSLRCKILSKRSNALRQEPLFPG